MSTNYKLHKFRLTDIQQRKLRAGKEITLKFSKAGLQGNDELYVTKTIKARIDKAIAGGKGTTIHFSRAMIKANQSGGALSALLPIAQQLFSIAGQTADATDTGSKIQRRLQYLRGGAIAMSVENGAKLGAMVAEGDQQAIKLADNLKEKYGVDDNNQTGSGLHGAGVKEFFEAFWWGLTHPIDALELAGREIARAIKGKGVNPLGKGIKPLGKGVKNIGTGIKFY